MLRSHGVCVGWSTGRASWRTRTGTSGSSPTDGAPNSPYDPYADPANAITYVYGGGNRLERHLLWNGLVIERSYARNVGFDANGDVLIPANDTDWEILTSKVQSGGGPGSADPPTTWAYYGGLYDRMLGTRFDSLGRERSGIADPERRVWPSITWEDGSTSTQSFHPRYERVTEEVDRLGRKTSYTLDANGNVLQKTIGQVVAVPSVPAAERPAEAIATFSYTYNGRGQRLTETDANGNTTEYFYSPTGSVSDIDNAAGGHLVRVLESADQAGGTRAAWTYAWNTTRGQLQGGGQLTSGSDPLGRTVTYTYDPRSRVVQAQLHRRLLRDRHLGHRRRREPGGGAA